MKKIYLSLIAWAIASSAFAQWDFSGPNMYNLNAGNVGIGTQTPITKLDLNGELTLRSGSTVANSIIPAVNVNARTMRFNYNSNTSNEGFQFYNSITSSNIMMITGSGRVGIGKTSPATQLHVSSNATNTTQTIDVLRNGVAYGNAALVFGSPRSDTDEGTTSNGRGMIRVDGNSTDASSTMYIGANSSGLSGTVDMATRQSYLKIVGAALNAPNSYFEYRSGTNSVLHAGGDGTVGIGTTTPSGKLDVNGDIKWNNGASVVLELCSCRR